jgi:hypothetical protein
MILFMKIELIIELLFHSQVKCLKGVPKYHKYHTISQWPIYVAEQKLRQHTA